MSPIRRETRLRRRTLYRGRVVDLHVDEVRLPSGARHVREVVDHRPAVAVVPVLEDGRVLLVRQFRYAVARALWELPAGLVDAGESPRRAAVRELREETGYLASRLEKLVEIYSSPGFCRERILLYLARGVRRRGGQDLDHDEFVEPRGFPFQDVLRRVREGRLHDAKTVLGLTLAARVLSVAF